MGRVLARLALRRAGRAGFARNICVGLGNWGSSDAVPVRQSDPSVLDELAIAMDA